MGKEQKEFLEDDTKEPVKHLVEHRLPWLILGLLGGIFTSIIVSKYETILSADIRLAFFIPIIVYMSDAVGTQTETIYIRHLRKSGANFLRYILKETALGLSLGAIFGFVIGLFASYWLGSFEIGLTVGLTMFINVTLAPVLATLIPTLLYKEHSDPALGSGPLATIIQDLISLLIYFVVAAVIVF
ncbi:MAG: magnesium transporter [Candidatus Doudnabacteria bacterium]|nr:magnesium transporter [Candidatus Doudnabacteria bacterium]